MSLLHLETDRLRLRPLEESDTTFLFEIMNDPQWLQYIGDRGIVHLDAALDYLRFGPIKMYREYGYGMLLVSLKDNQDKIGLCGLVKRHKDKEPDLGYAMLSRYRGKGYAKEASLAVIQAVKSNLPLKELDALVHPENRHSIRLLESIGFRFQQDISDDKQQTLIYQLEL